MESEKKKSFTLIQNLRDEKEENESNDDEDLMLQTNSASYWKRETKCHEFYRGRKFLFTALNHGLERNKKKPAIA